MTPAIAAVLLTPSVNAVAFMVVRQRRCIFSRANHLLRDALDATAFTIQKQNAELKPGWVEPRRQQNAAVVMRPLTRKSTNPKELDMPENQTEASDSVVIDQPLVHTPGPWIVKRRFDVYEDTQTPGVGGTYIGTTRGNNELPESVNRRCEADAKLIAAAPELLEAVKRLQLAIGDFCCMNCISESDLESDGSDLLDASKTADAVLAKVL